MVLKLLSQVSVQELYNSTVSTSEEVGLNEARDADNNIIISDSTLPNILPPQLKNMSVRYKVMGGWECFISTKSMYYSLLRGRDNHVKNSNTKFTMRKTEGLVKSKIAFLKYIRVM